MFVFGANGTYLRMGGGRAAVVVKCMVRVPSRTKGKEGARSLAAGPNTRVREGIEPLWFKTTVPPCPGSVSALPGGNCLFV